MNSQDSECEMKEKETYRNMVKLVVFLLEG